jgi:hypothetical protein
MCREHTGLMIEATRQLEVRRLVPNLNGHGGRRLAAAHGARQTRKGRPVYLDSFTPEPRR